MSDPLPYREPESQPRRWGEYTWVAIGLFIFMMGFLILLVLS